MEDHDPPDGKKEAAPAIATANEGLQARIKELEGALGNTKKELAVKVKHYEGKLVTMTVINSALQSENDKLKEEAATYGGPSTAEQELKELHEEFTKRLGVAEKTAAVMKEECFSLRKEGEESKRTREGLIKQIAEKDTAILQYKGEGEVLAKKMGDLEGIIKKLRVDLGKSDQEKDKLQARVQVLEAAAKSVEATKTASLEEANQTIAALRQALAGQKEHFTQLLDAADQRREAEVQNLREDLSQLSSRSAKEVQERERFLSASLDALRQSLSQANQEASEQEDKLRGEIARLEQRSRAAELAQEEAAARATEATRPLVRQMEGLSAHLARIEASAQEREQVLQRQVADAEAAMWSAVERQRRAEASASSADRRAELAERAAEESRAEAAAAQQQLRDDDNERKALKERYRAALERAQVAEEGQKEAMLALASARQQKEAAERALQLAKLEIKGEVEEERKKLEQEKAALEKREREIKRQGSSGGLSSLGGSGRQISGREKNNGWLDDELGEGRKGTPPLDDIPSPQRRSSGGLGGFLGMLRETDSVTGGGSLTGPSGGTGSGKGGGSAVAMERLMAKVRQQAGEIGQLQRELAAASAGRDHASEELLKISQRLQAIEQEGRQTPQLQKELEDLRKRHDMALVIIGERNERVEELEADLADVKSLYREQMNLMISEVDPEKWPSGFRICLFCSHCSQVQRNKQRGN